MLTQFLKSGSLALALLLSSGSVQTLFAQHHGGGHHGGGHHGGGHHGGSTHHHHGGSGFYFGSGGFGYGSGYGYGGNSGYYGLGYSSGYGPGYYNSYPGYGYSNYGSGYGYSGSNVYVTPQYVTPRYGNSSSTIIYQSPSVQPYVQSSRMIPSPPQDSGQPTNLPGVSFGSRAHIGELGNAVADRTNQLCIALHASYLGNPQFNEVYRDVYSLMTRGKQLAQENGTGDSQEMLAQISDMNAILAQAAPVIESWRATNGGQASATSHLSSVQSALKLLSIDAGWDASQAVSRPSIPAGTPESAPVQVAPSPDSLPTEANPTPLDPVPEP